MGNSVSSIGGRQLRDGIGLQTTVPSFGCDALANRKGLPWEQHLTSLDSTGVVSLVVLFVYIKLVGVGLAAKFCIGQSWPRGKNVEGPQQQVIRAAKGA